MVHSSNTNGSEEDAIIITLLRKNLQTQESIEKDLQTFEHQLAEAIETQDAGEFDGDELGSEEIALFMYGPDADQLYAAVEPILRKSPLANVAQITLQYGAPGGKERVIH